MHKHDHCDVKTFKSLKWSMLIIGSIFLVELFGGLFSGSLALLGDSWHMLMDFAALFLTFFTMRLGCKLPTEKRTFGLHRTEIFAAFANGIFLLVIVVFMAVHAVKRILVPTDIHTGVMLWVAVVGLVANLIVAFKLHGHHDLNVKGAYLHVMGDTLSSIAVIIGAIVIHFTGIRVVDPILSLVIVTVILVGALKLVWESGNVLLESTPKGIELKDVVREMKKAKHVKDVHAIHFWSVCSNVNVVSAHIFVDIKDICDTLPIVEELNERLKKFKVKHSTFQFENTKCKMKGMLKHLKH